MSKKVGLKDILLKDVGTAQSGGPNMEILEPGVYEAKVIGFTEEDTYQYVTLEINKKRFNFFYNYYLYESDVLDKDLLDWLQALSTITTTAKTTMLEIANSAIGNTYKVTIYNYESKSGKNAGKTQHAISFRDLPIKVDATIVDEELELPFL